MLQKTPPSSPKNKGRRRRSAVPLRFLTHKAITVPAVPGYCANGVSPCLLPGACLPICTQSRFSANDRLSLLLQSGYFSRSTHFRFYTNSVLIIPIILQNEKICNCYFDGSINFLLSSKYTTPEIKVSTTLIQMTPLCTRETGNQPGIQPSSSSS